MHRGRLIQRFNAALVRVDAAATAAVEGGGFDSIFKEPILVDTDTHRGEPSRREHEEIMIPVQVASRNWGGTTAALGGAQVEADMALIMLLRDIEGRGLVDENGRVLIQQGDRIDRIETLGGVLEERFPDPPGLYVVTVRKSGHGLGAFSAPRNNLVYVVCNTGRVK